MKTFNRLSEIKELSRTIINSRISVNLINKNLSLDKLDERNKLLHLIQVRTQRLLSLTTETEMPGVSNYIELSK